jgi:hypothetical protein
MPYKPQIFISYSRQDEIFASRLAQSLIDLGADIWMDVLCIHVGENWSEAVQRALETSDLMLLIISPDSMDSRHTRAEWQYFHDQEKPIVPVVFRPAHPHFQLLRLQRVNFDNAPYEEALKRLHIALRNKGIDLQPPPHESTIEGRDVPPLRPGKGPRQRADEFPPHDLYRSWRRKRGIPQVLTGERHGSYNLIDELHVGGLTEICLARSQKFDRLVAVKWLLPEYSQDQSMVARFRHYYEITVRFDHPAVLSVNDYGMIAPFGIPFIVMGYVDDGTLADWIARNKLTLGDIRNTLQDTARALDYGSRQGFLHGNLTPDHILLDKRGRASLAHLGFDAAFGDCGLAKRDLRYLAPEVLRGGPVTAASDIYALGLIAFEMLAGRYPYRFRSDADLKNRHQYEPLPPLNRFRSGLPALLDQVLARATSKNPEQRFATAGAFAEAFQLALARQ